MATVLAELPHSDRKKPAYHELQQELGKVARKLQHAESLAAAEAGLEEVIEILGLRWPAWNGDITRPNTCPEAIRFALDHSWPSSALDFWQNHHEPLKIPVYIKCRFEHLPFVIKIERTKEQKPASNNVKYYEFMQHLGIQAVLIVPVHLPKGQIGILAWAGSIPSEELETIANAISMELLAIGHHFMRIYRNVSGYNTTTDEEFSSLTPREWDCLRVLAQGYREPDAAIVLGLTKSTVRFHLNNVVKKFGCKNRTQAIALAAQLGLLGPIGA